MNLQAISFKTALFLLLAYSAGYFSFSYLWILFIALLWVLDTQLTRKRVEERIYQDVRDLEKNVYHYDEMRLECVELIEMLPRWAQNPSTESVSWMNKMIAKLWPGLRQALRSNIIWNIGYYLIYYKPSWMDKFFLHKADLGSNPLLIEGIELMESRSDMIIMDLLLRMSFRDALILIKMAFKGFSTTIRVTDINFTCRIRVKLSPLISQWPCFGELAIGFVGKPSIDMRMELGGFPLTSIPLFHGWLMKYLEDMCVWCMGCPVMLAFPMIDPPSEEEKKASDVPEGPPQGILRVVVHKMLYLGDSAGRIRRTMTNSKVICEAGIGTRTQSTAPVDLHKKITLVNQSFEFIVYDVKTEKLAIKARTSGMDMITKANKGKALFDISMLEHNKPVDVWQPLEGVDSGHVFVSLTWKPFIHDGLGILQSAIKSEGSFSCAALHVRVIKGQVNYQELHDREKAIDSRVGIQCGTQFRKTRVVSKSNNPTYNESFVIPVRDLFQESVEVALERNVGTSVLRHFQNVAKLRIQLQDYLKMGEHVSFFPFRNNLGGLTLALEVLQLDPTRNIELPSKPIKGILSVTIHGGSDLPVMDNNGASDPYVCVTCAGKKMKTKVAKKTLNPTWDQTFSFRVDDLMHEVLYLDVLDHDMIGDDRMGTSLIPCAQVALGAVTKQHFLLEHAKSGSIVLSMQWNPDEKLAVEDMHRVRSALLRNSTVDFSTPEHMLRLESHPAVACRGATVCVANLKKTHHPRQSKRALSTYVPSHNSNSSPPRSNSDLGAISEQGGAAELRRPKAARTRSSMSDMKQLTSESPPMGKGLLKPLDLSSLVVDEDKEDHGDDEKVVFAPVVVEHEEPAAVEADVEPLEGIRVSVHWCKDLVAADDNGLSDPYVSISVVSKSGKVLKKLKTSKKTKTLNPMYEETVEFTASACSTKKLSLDTSCSLLFRVFDHDRFSKDDLLGQYEMTLDDISTTELNREECKLKEAIKGSICFSVSLL